MRYKTVITKHNLLEEIQYPNTAFPLAFYKDCLDDYLNGEIGYHWHDAFEFGIILQGEVKYYIHQKTAKQESEILKAGDGIFVNSESLHRTVQTTPGTILFDFVLPANFFVLLPMGEVHQKNIIPVIQSPTSGLFLKAGNGEDRDLLNCMRDIYNLSQKNIGYELQCIELICRLWRYLLVRIARMQDASSVLSSNCLQEQRLRQMLSYIHAHYGENITINSLAATANVSRSECFRCFRSVIGKTPSEYLCQYRLSQAAYFLAYTDRTISDICFSCGFKSASYFGKLFRQACGISPGQYRKESGKRAELPEEYDGREAKYMV